MTTPLQKALWGLAAGTLLAGLGGCQQDAAQTWPDMAFLTANAPAIKPNSNLFPMRVGTRWVIERSMGRSATMTDSVVAEARKAGASTRVVVTTRTNGRVIQQEVYLVDSSGVKRVATGPSGQVTLDPPMPLLRFPLRDGDTYEWHGNLRAGGKSTPADATYQLTGPEMLTVKAGSYKTYRLDVLMSTPVNGVTQRVPFSIWFAPDVGMVKQQTGIQGRQINSELVKMAAAR